MFFVCLSLDWAPAQPSLFFLCSLVTQHRVCRRESHSFLEIIFLLLLHDCYVWSSLLKFCLSANDIIASTSANFFSFIIFSFLWQQYLCQLTCKFIALISWMCVLLLHLCPTRPILLFKIVTLGLSTMVSQTQPGQSFFWSPYQMNFKADSPKPAQRSNCPGGDKVDEKTCFGPINWAFFFFFLSS